VLEPVHEFSEGKKASEPSPAPAPSAAAPIPGSRGPEAAGRDSLFGKLFGVRKPEAASATSPPPVPPADRPVPPVVPVSVETRPAPSHRREEGYRREEGALREEIGERVNAGLHDMSRLLAAIKETLQSRDGQVQQTLQALPGFLQQVPRIHRAEIECLAQISKQLEHMGTGTRDVLARLDAVPDLLRGLALAQQDQGRYLDGLQARMAEALDGQAKALREGLETSRKTAESQLATVRGLARTQEDIFATFQNTQNRALNVFHRAQQQAHHQHKETQKVLGRQIEMLVEKVHVAQTRVFWLSIGFAALAAAGLVAVLLFG
jgi:hypothetical protein